jgi:hypothetical protein
MPDAFSSGMEQNMDKIPPLKEACLKQGFMLSLIMRPKQPQ